MNSKFLKKLALSCLVLGAVNYGNIGNTMDDDPNNGNAIGQEQGIIINNDINIIANEDNYIRFEKNHYIGAVNGESFDVDANEIKLNEFPKGWCNIELYETLANSNIKDLLNPRLNNIIRGRLNLFYRAFITYMQYKDVILSDFEDIVKNKLLRRAAGMNFELNQEQLDKSIKSILEDYSEDISDIKNNKYNNKESIGAFLKLFSDVIKHLSDDFKLIRYYTKEEKDGGFNFSKDIRWKDGEKEAVVVDKEYTSYKDISFRLCGYTTNEGEKLEYSKTSNLIKLILKYEDEKICKKLFCSGGAEYVIDNQEVVTFKDNFEKLKDLSNLILKKGCAIEFFNNECNDDFDAEVSKLIEEQKRKEKEEQEAIAKSAFEKLGKKPVVKLADDSVFIDNNEYFASVKQKHQEKKNALKEKGLNKKEIIQKKQENEKVITFGANKDNDNKIEQKEEKDLENMLLNRKDLQKDTAEEKQKDEKVITFGDNKDNDNKIEQKEEKDLENMLLNRKNLQKDTAEEKQKDEKVITFGANKNKNKNSNANKKKGGKVITANNKFDFTTFIDEKK